MYDVYVLYTWDYFTMQIRHVLGKQRSHGDAFIIIFTIYW